MVRALFSFLISFFFVADAWASCIGGETQLLEITHDLVTFQVGVECDGGDCQCGTNYWGEETVARRLPGGGVPTTMQIVSISPNLSSGASGGAEWNPLPTQNGQGFIRDTYVSYTAALDVSDNLPFTVTTEGSLYVTTESATGCNEPSDSCVVENATFTFLDDIPANIGDMFRPPMMSSNASDRVRVFTTDLDLSTMPLYAPFASNAAQKPFADIIARWADPEFDALDIVTTAPTASPKFAGELGPGVMVENILTQVNYTLATQYGSSMAQAYLDDVLSVLGDEAATGDKLQAIYALAQQGLDRWGDWDAGASWTSSAGLNNGRFFQVATYGALTTNQTVKAQILAADSNDFSVYFQFANGPENTPFYGDQEDILNELKGNCRFPIPRHWDALVESECTNGETPGSCTPGNFGSSRSCPDPHGFITGAVYPGRTYDAQMGGPGLGMLMVGYLWPEWRAMFKTERYYKWVERVMIANGTRTGSDWQMGYDITTPDPCQPPPPSLGNDDVPASSQVGYGLPAHDGGWGEVSGTGDCVRHGGNPLTDGRYTSATLTGFAPNRTTIFAWDTLREDDSNNWLRDARRCDLAGQEHVAHHWKCFTETSSAGF